MERRLFNEIEIMPEDYEVINCPNCFEKHKRINQNHYVLCGNTKRNEIYLLCLSCGKIFKGDMEKESASK